MHDLAFKQKSVRPDCVADGLRGGEMEIEMEKEKETIKGAKTIHNEGNESHDGAGDSDTEDDEEYMENELMDIESEEEEDAAAARGAKIVYKPTAQERATRADSHPISLVVQFLCRRKRNSKCPPQAEDQG